MISATYRGVVIGCTLMVSSCAIAEVGRLGLAIEVGLGYANQEEAVKELSQDLANSTGRSVKASGQNGAGMGRLFAYYGLTDTLDIEIGYFSLADIPTRIELSGIPAIDVGVGATGLTGGVSYSLSDNFHTRVGVHRSEMTGTISSGNVSESVDISGTGFYLGGGYKIGESWGLAFTAYRSLGGSSGDNVGLFSFVYQPR